MGRRKPGKPKRKRNLDEVLAGAHMTREEFDWMAAKLQQSPDALPYMRAVWEFVESCNERLKQLSVEELLELGDRVYEGDVPLEYRSPIDPTLEAAVLGPDEVQDDRFVVLDFIRQELEQRGAPPMPRSDS